MTKIVTRRGNGTQSILVTILRLPSEPRVTLHLFTLKTKIVEKMGMRAKLISSPDNLEIVFKLTVFFSVIQYLHENMCITIKCYLLKKYHFYILFCFTLSCLPLLSFFLVMFDAYYGQYYINIIAFKWKFISN